MRYLQYKGVVEREYKKSLKKVMYDLCVTEQMNASQGAKHLGIAKEIFIYWRRHYRFEKRQLLFDQTVQDLVKREDKYAEEVQRLELKRPIEYKGEKTIRGLEEAVERMIENYKYLHFESGGLSLKTAKLPLYQFSQSVVKSYQAGSLSAEVEQQVEKHI